MIFFIPLIPYFIPTLDFSLFFVLKFQIEMLIRKIKYEFGNILKEKGILVEGVK